MKNFQRIHGTTLQTLDVFDAATGRVVPVLNREDVGFSNFGRVYLSVGMPGVVKDWHFHNIQIEHFTVIQGSVKLVLYDGRKDSPTCTVINELVLNGNEPTRIRIPPGVTHGIRTDSDQESLAIICASEPYNFAKPDKVWVNLKNVPYQWSTT